MNMDNSIFRLMEGITFRQFVANVGNARPEIGRGYMGNVNFSEGLPEGNVYGTMTVIALSGGLVKYIFDVPVAPYGQWWCYSLNGGEPTEWTKGEGGSGVADLMIETRWAELKNLRDNGQLVPGMQYRITDYQTTTNTTNTKSAGHKFDIIVTADGVKTLNENARVCIHGNDKYFKNSKLEAWVIKYCIDNDTSRFGWIDTRGGTGVIYYMKDEFDNECPYDFKNIQFARFIIKSVSYNKIISNNNSRISPYESHPLIGEYGIGNDRIKTLTDKIYFYTFSSMDDKKDNSLYFNYNPENLNESIGAGHNSMETYMVGNVMQLNNNVFINKISYSNKFGKSCARNTFNTSIVLYNTFGDSVYDNTFAKIEASSNDEVSFNEFKCYIHTNAFGSNIKYNTFDTGTYYNAFGSTVLRNTFGKNFSYNMFGDGVYANSLQNDIFYNNFGVDIDSNTIGNQITYNIFGNYIYRNSIGNRFYGNDIGSNFYQCTIDDCVNSNVFGSFLKSISIFSMVKNCNIADGSSTKYIQNIQILNGTHDVSISPESGLYVTQVVGLKTTGDIIIWRPADR